jgi:hypothetical protein
MDIRNLVRWKAVNDLQSGRYFIGARSSRKYGGDANWSIRPLQRKSKQAGCNEQDLGSIGPAKRSVGSAAATNSMPLTPPTAMRAFAGLAPFAPPTASVNSAPSMALPALMPSACRDEAKVAKASKGKRATSAGPLQSDRACGSTNPDWPCGRQRGNARRECAASRDQSDPRERAHVLPSR